MSEITVIVGEPPYGKERIYTTLRFVQTALEEGHKVNLFLFEDAIFATKNGQSPHEFPGTYAERMPNCEVLLQEVIKKGARVKLCGACSTARGVSEDDVRLDAQMGNMGELVQWVTEADRVVCF